MKLTRRQLLQGMGAAMLFGTATAVAARTGWVTVTGNHIYYFSVRPLEVTVNTCPDGAMVVEWSGDDPVEWSIVR